MATSTDLSRSVLHGSAEAADSPCTICHTRDRSEVKSTNYCVDCDSNMCGACTTSHASFPAMASHQVVDISRGPGKPAQKLPLPTQRCEEHHGKLLDRYCEDHDVIACETCVNINHRKCIQLKYVPKYAKGISNTYKFEVIKRSTEELLEKLINRRSLQRDTLQHLQKAKVQSLQELNEQTETLHMYIEDLLKSESAKITLKYQEKVEAVQKDMAVINDQIDITETINEKLIKFASIENESDLFVYIKQGEKNEKDATQVIDTSCQADMAIPTYKVDSTVEMSLKSITSLGDFKVTVVKLNKEVDIKTTNDEIDCYITGVCFLPDASVIIADGNNSLKHLDASYMAVNWLDLSTDPCGVCYINNKEVAVTLDEEHKVQFVSVGASMKKTRSFPVDGKCEEICYSDNELFICFDDVEGPTRECVRVYDLSGTVLRTIQHEPTGQPLFYDLCDLTISSCGRKLHINNYDTGVLTVDRTGNLLSTFTDPKLKGFCGICTLENGDLFVCGFDSNNVLQISKDGMNRGVVLTEEDDIDQPQTLGYDYVQSRLIVYSSNCNTLNIYDVHLS